MVVRIRWGLLGALLAATSSARCSILLDARDLANTYRNQHPPLDGSASDGSGIDTGIADGGSDAGGLDGSTKDGSGIDSGSQDSGPMPDSGPPPSCTNGDGGCIPPSAQLNRSFDAREVTRVLTFDTLNCAITALPSFTIEFWLKYTNNPNNTRVLISQTSTNLSADGWVIRLDSAPARGQIAFQNVIQGLVSGVRSTPVLMVNTWHHVAIEGNSANVNALSIAIFIDGQPNNQGTLPIDPSFRSTPMRIEGNNLIPFRIDELRISTNERYPLGVPFVPLITASVDANTLDYWSMDESDTSIVASDSACRHHGSTQAGSFITDAP